jgi:hypothetical protein
MVDKFRGFLKEERKRKVQGYTKGEFCKAGLII